MSCWRFLLHHIVKAFLKMLKWKLAPNHILETQRQHDALYSTAISDENFGNNAQNCSEFCLLSKRTILTLENSKLYVSLTTSSCPWFHLFNLLLTWILMRMGCCNNSLVSESDFSFCASSGSWHCCKMDFVRFSWLYLSLGFCLFFFHIHLVVSPAQ